jgi:hypothetical protein
MTKKKTSEASNITATRLILKKRKAAMSLDAINNALKKANMKPVTAETLDKNFRHVCTKSGQKWLLGGAPAVKSGNKKDETEKPKCNKKPCGKKVLENKKVCPTKSACRNSGKDSVSSFCSIRMSSNFGVAEYNQRASLHNALVNLPSALESPNEYVFLVGVGSWPDAYRGVEIESNQNFSGVLLCPKKYMQKVEV